LLWLAGVDLRLILLAVPPVIPALHRDLRLSEAGIGALNGLPVLLMAAAAVPGSLLIARVGARRALLTGLVLVGAAGALRGAGPEAEPDDAPPARWWPDWRSWRTWQAGLLLGCISMLYWGSNAFLPDFLNATGRKALVTPALAVFNAAQLPVSILIALAPGRF